MKRSITLELPYPPSVNHYWFRSRSGGMFIGPKGVKFRQETVLEVIKQKIKKLDGFLKASIKLYPPDKRRRDVDNTQKVIFDSLQKASVYDDDYQIQELNVKRLEPIPGGKTIVTIEEV